MIRTVVCLLAVGALQIPLAGSRPGHAQESPSAPADTAAGADTLQGSRIYYGGGVSLDVGSHYTRISLVPQVGFQLTRKFSVGARVRYDYVNDRRLSIRRDSHDYGGGIFSRYRFIPHVYGHAEYSYMSYEFSDDRRGVPFLLVGAGYSQPIGEHVSFYAEILVDLINDENSPYDAGEPRLNLGIQAGFF